jgi:hypothetical protein
VLYVILCLAAMDGPLSGDDHYSLWAAAAAAAGDRPYIDFFDPGSPLQWGLSFLGQIVSGNRPIGEVVLAVAMKSLGILFVYWLCRELIGGRAAAVGAAAVVAVLLLAYNAYGWDKVVIYPASVLVAWRYLDGRLSPWVLSIPVAVAFLLRHDHGAYVGFAMTVAVLFGPRPHVRALCSVALGTLLLLGPWLLWVGTTEGLFNYFGSRIGFARALGLTESRPGVGFVAPYVSAENGARWLWHLAILIPIAALVLAARRRLPKVAVLAAALLVAEPGVMRQALQAKELAVLWVPLCFWVLAQVRGPLALAGAGGVAVVSLVAIIGVTRAPQRLSQIVFDGGGLFTRAISAVKFHSRSSPLDAYAPPGTTNERMMVRYVHDCLRPQDRVWDTSVWFPLSYYSARRPVWHPYWELGLLNEETAQRRFLAWLLHTSAPIVIVRDRPDEPMDAFRLYPAVRAYVAEHYRQVTSDTFERFVLEADSIQVLVDRRRLPTGVFRPLDLPCFGDPPAS